MEGGGGGFPALPQTQNTLKSHTPARSAGTDPLPPPGMGRVSGPRPWKAAGMRHPRVLSCQNHPGTAPAQRQGKPGGRSEAQDNTWLRTLGAVGAPHSPPTRLSPLRIWPCPTDPLTWLLGGPAAHPDAAGAVVRGGAGRACLAGPQLATLSCQTRDGGKKGEVRADIRPRISRARGWTLFLHGGGFLTMQREGTKAPLAAPNPLPDPSRQAAGVFVASPTLRGGDIPHPTATPGRTGLTPSPAATAGRSAGQAPPSQPRSFWWGSRREEAAAAHVGVP